ncbi:MAG: DUF551 domain-containing protein [Acinetobacter sp.]
MSWISVKDKLPNDLDNVDLLINAKRRLTDCTYTDDRFYTHQCKDEYWKEIKDNITHWMLAPELPKDES